MQTHTIDRKYNFPTDWNSIQDRIQSIDPIKYAATRNFENGALTLLGPYISRGVLSSKFVFEHIKSLDLEWKSTEKLIQELAWSQILILSKRRFFTQECPMQLLRQKQALKSLMRQ